MRDRLTDRRLRRVAGETEDTTLLALVIVPVTLERRVSSDEPVATRLTADAPAVAL